MKHIISFSGGAGSFVAAKRVVEKYGKENVVCVFCDTNIEDEDLYRFVSDAIKYLDCEFVHLNTGEKPWDVYRRKKYMSNSRVSHCNVELKGKPFQKWLSDNYKPDECVLYFGFDFTEEHRLKKAQKNYKHYNCEAPLLDKPLLNDREIKSMIIECGIEIPRLYKLGFSHNNCGGFCVKAGQAHFANLLKEMPERYKHHERQQEKLFKDLPETNHPFIRMTIDGKINYLTLKEFRKHVQAGKQIDIFDFGGCGCFSEVTQ